MLSCSYESQNVLKVLTLYSYFLRETQNYLRIRGQDLEGFENLRFRHTSANIKKVRRLAAIKLHDIHRGHGESSSVDKATNVTVHADVI